MTACLLGAGFVGQIATLQAGQMDSPAGSGTFAPIVPVYPIDPIVVYPLPRGLARGSNVLHAEINRTAMPLRIVH